MNAILTAGIPCKKSISLFFWKIICMELKKGEEFEWFIED
jgi:hypothetical protein